MQTPTEYWKEVNSHEPRTAHQKLEVAMIGIYAEKRCEALAEVLNKPHEKLKPLEDLYRQENPIPGDEFYIPGKVAFYEWIVKKIMWNKI